MIVDTIKKKIRLHCWLLTIIYCFPRKGLCQVHDVENDLICSNFENEKCGEIDQDVESKEEVKLRPTILQEVLNCIPERLII